MIPATTEVEVKNKMMSQKKPDTKYYIPRNPK